MFVATISLLKKMIQFSIFFLDSWSMHDRFGDDNCSRATIGNMFLSLNPVLSALIGMNVCNKFVLLLQFQSLTLAG